MTVRVAADQQLQRDSRPRTSTMLYQTSYEATQEQGNLLGPNICIGTKYFPFECLRKRTRKLSLAKYWSVSVSQWYVYPRTHNAPKRFP